MVSQVLKETWELKETGVRSACSGPVERTALRVPKAELAPLESLVHLALLEKRVNWAFQDFQVIQEDKDLRAQVVSPASLEPTERKEPGASQENQVPEGREDQLVLVEPEEPEVRQENQVQREHQGMTVLQVHPGREGLKDLRGPWASPDRRALLVLQGRMDCPGTLVSVERRVSKEKLVHQVQEV